MEKFNKLKKQFKEKNVMFYLKIIALFFIPSLYTVTYLAANVDPYTAMNQVPVGIVNLDEGYTVNDKHINIGDDVVDGMIESNGFDFSEVNQEDFTFDNYFMKVEIPKDFSKSIINFVDNDFSQSKIILEVDESKNYIFASIVQEAIYEMQSETNNEIVKSYLTATFDIAGISIDLLNDYNQKITKKVEETNVLIDQYQSDIQAVVDNSKNKYSNIKIKTQEDLNNLTTNLKNDLININNKGISLLEEIKTKFYDLKKDYLDFENDILSSTHNILVKKIFKIIDKNLVEIENSIISQISDLESNKTYDIESYINSLNSTFKEDKKKFDEKFNASYNNLVAYYKDTMSQIDQVQEKLVNNKLLNKQITIDGNVDKAINFFASPTTFETKRTNQVEGYGQGLAPFFISLSLYVGALIILTIFPLHELKYEVKNLTFKKNILFFTLLSVGQVSVLFLLLKFVNHLVFIHPLMFFIYSLAVSFFFVMLMLLLVIVLNDVGKFLAFLLLVFQLGGSGGTFPIETSPSFFQAIHKFLPMSYTVDKYREVMFIENVSIIVHLIVLISLSLAILVILYFFTKRFNTYKK